MVRYAVALTAAVGYCLLGQANAACTGVDPPLVATSCSGSPCQFTFTGAGAGAGCTGKTAAFTTCNIVPSAGYTGGSATCKADDTYGLVAATVKPCGTIVGVNAQCGCAINEKVSVKAAIASSVMTIASTDKPTKKVTAAASFTAAGFATGDWVEFSGGADCEMLNAGAAAPTKIASIAADGLSLTTDDDHPGASESTSGQCKIERKASLICEACGAGLVQAAADATPQTTARACSAAPAAGGGSPCDRDPKPKGCSMMMGAGGIYTNTDQAPAKALQHTTLLAKRLVKVATDVGDSELAGLLDPTKAATYYLRDAATNAQVEAGVDTILKKLKTVRCYWDNPDAAVDPKLPDPYAARGEYKCYPEYSFWEEIRSSVYSLCILLLGWLIYCALAVVVGKRSFQDVMKGPLKVCGNIYRTVCKNLVCGNPGKYLVGEDDKEHFDARGCDIPKPPDMGADGKLIGRTDPAKTNIYKYLVWRRRSLYAVLFPCLVLFAEAVFVTAPKLEIIWDNHYCKPGESMLGCTKNAGEGTIGNLARFLTADGGASGLQIYTLILVTLSVLMGGFQCIAVRIASGRGCEWIRSSRWVALSWLIPFAWNYLQFVLPLTRAYGVGWDDRADHMVMMPLLSSNPNSKSFDMCTAVSLCATNIDIARFTGTNMISGLDLRGVTLAQAKTWMTDTWKNNRDSDNQAFMYKSQSGPGLPEGVFMSDGGELSVGNMMDNLDFLMGIFVGAPPGMIQKSTEPMLKKLGGALEALVRADVTFKCLMTLAPLAMSVIPALMKGATTAKLIFPQDPMVGWIVRGVPMLSLPLHAVFLLVIGQMFSDWWICLAVICLMIGDGALTWFGQKIPNSYATWQGPKQAISTAKKKGLLFTILGLILLVIGLASNDLLPELSLSVDVTFGKIMNLLHTIVLFVLKFLISKNLVTIIFCDFILKMVFGVNEEMQNYQLQDPYQREASIARLFMTREWLEGEPKPSSALMDFLGADNVPGPTNPDANYVGGLVKCKFDLKRASQLFDQLDVDRGGTLDEKELEGLLGQMGYQTNPVEVAKMMSYMDTDGEGEISREEFMKYFGAHWEVFVIHRDNTKNVICMPTKMAEERALPLQSADQYANREPGYVLTGEAAKRACGQPAASQPRQAARPSPRTRSPPGATGARNVTPGRP